MFPLIDHQSFVRPETAAPSRDTRRATIPAARVPLGDRMAPNELFAPAGEQQPRLSVLLVDGDSRRRELMARSLAEAGAGAVHEVASSDEARHRAADGPPCDLAVVELTLADGGALGLVNELRLDGWRTVVLGPDDHAVAAAAFKAGALAYLSSPSGPGVHHVLEADTVAPTPTGSARMAAVDGAPRELSAREVQVVQSVADGQSNAEIGEALGLSALTVKSHLSRIGRKLGTGDRAQMVALAMRARVIH